MTKAVKVREENLELLVSWAASKDRDLSTYLSDTYNDAQEEGQELYLVISPDQWAKDLKITEVTSDDFFANWQFVDGEMEDHFNEIVKKK